MQQCGTVPAQLLPGVPVLLVGGTAGERAPFSRWVQELTGFSAELGREALPELSVISTDQPFRACCRSYPLVIALLGAEDSGRADAMLEMIQDQAAREGEGACPRVIFVTAAGSIGEAVSVMRKGAQDYLSRPLSREAFQTSVSRALEAFHGGDVEVRVQNGRAGAPLSQSFRMAYTDEATGLWNARYLRVMLDQRLLPASDSARPSFSLLFVDADDFKRINDRHGHQAGNRALVELSACLRRGLRDGDSVFRYGGDEFVVLLSHADRAGALSVAERIRSTVEQQSLLSGLVPGGERLTVSIGVSVFPEDGLSRETLLDAADHALYGVKRTSKNAVFEVTSIARPIPSSIRSVGGGLYQAARC